MYFSLKLIAFGIILSTFNFNCAKENSHGVSFKATRCVILLIDGPRWQETGGDTTHQYMPNMYNNLYKEGCVFTNFYNNGPTYTLAGHSASLTGNYEPIANDGTEFPQYPGLFQL